MAATKTLRREFLQLADTYNPDKHTIAGFYVSEKLDGTRCFWDGGLTRGMKTELVPWAGINDPKTGKKKAKIKPTSTGLWSRYGNPIMAPDWFLNALPSCPLDGELWAGRGNFQLCRSICAGDDADPRFDQISYAVYSTPSLPAILATGLIKSAQMLREIDLAVCEKFVKQRLEDFDGDYKFVEAGSSFEQELLFLRNAIETQNDQVFLHRQVRLPNDEAAARFTVDKLLSDLLDQGAEGVVIRNPASIWTPKRHKGLLKFKPYEDAEATIIGFRAGKEGKQGNVLGKIGTLLVRTVELGNVEFEIGSGLTFEQREFGDEELSSMAAGRPGEIMPAKPSDHIKGAKDCGVFYHAKHFKIGDTISFKYRELSDDGVPKEARYWRKRDTE